MHDAENAQASRRRLLKTAFAGAVGTSALALAGCAATQQQSNPKSGKTFVLLPPGWAGGWIYRSTADWLRAQGHRVYTPTLTGLGDRSHLLSKDVNMDTHIADVQNLIKWEGLKDVTLVAHSFSGPVISGVAEKALDSLASVIFVNAYVPENGQAISDILSERARNNLIARKQKGELGDPAPPAAFYAIDQKNWAWVDGNHTQQPIGVQMQKLTLTGALNKVPRKTYVMCAKFARGRDYEKLYYNRFKDDPAWNTVSLEWGHLAMIDDPVRFAQMLEQNA